MKEIFEHGLEIHVQEAEYKRLLGYPPGHNVGGRVRELMDTTIQWYAVNGTPWAYARQAESFEISNGRIRIEGIEFTSQRLYDQFADAKAGSVVVAAVSAGASCEERARQLWKEEKPDEYFFMEVYGSAVVEYLITAAGWRLCDWADHHGMMVLPHYSPGYPGWDIKDQSALLKLIRKNGHGIPADIHVMDTGMLQPKKSLLAVFGVTSHVEKSQSLRGMIPCENCSLPSCQYRRVPYKYSSPQIEDVSRLQSIRSNTSDAHAKNNSTLLTNAKYSISPKALRKWSEERLHLEVLHDRSVEARFRYEGTTCSNLGQTIEFDYHIKVGPPAERYKIIETRLVPAPGDLGHTFMCRYLEDSKSLMGAIDTEKPLLGRPLEDVLAWNREYNPSGCYCNAASREHKWGLVFEVLHYALVENEKKRIR